MFGIKKEGMKSITKMILPAALIIGEWMPSDACTRVLYKGLDSLYVVARSLDWKTPIPTNLYVYSPGIEKVSSDKPNAIRWKSKYGAVYAVGYDGGVTEGMNEKGLVVNGLFCKTAVYEKKDVDTAKPYMSLSVFVAWLLDNCTTVDDVVAMLKPHDFRIQGAEFDGGTVSTLHWGVTDASGKSMVFEFTDGEIRYYDMGDYRAMTNDPEWPAMKAILDYWEKIGGRNMLPGTVSSPDRCVRANYFAHNVKAESDGSLGVSIARSVLVNSCVPYMYMVEGDPNVSSTQWRSYANIRDLRYYFDIVTNAGIYYIDMKKLDMSRGRIYKLDSSKHQEFAGCANGLLERSKGFKPMY